MGRNNKGQFEMTCSFGDWCLDNRHKDWLDLWDEELNEIGPDKVAFSSEKKFWFKCSRGIHSSETKAPGCLTSGRTHLFCVQCHSFGQWMVDNFGKNAIQQYYSDKNMYDWFSLSVHSGQEIWIKCDNKAHPDYDTRPDRFARGGRCPICTNKKIIAGINDIATTHSHLVKYFKNPDDAKQYSIHSGKKTWFKCHLCGLEKYTTIDAAFSKGYSCDGCGDGVSYPNKFVTAMLMQLHSKNNQIVFEREKGFDWAFVLDNKYSRVKGHKYYDIYLPTYNVIIENFGGQHYIQVNFNRSNNVKSLNEEKENDRIKYELAIKNGISKDHYIVLDCRESDANYIKSSIMKSKLPEILGFSEHDIDWDACDEFCFRDLSLQACMLKNDGYSVKDIMNKLHIAESTAYKYFRNGKRVGVIKEIAHNGSPILCVENGLVCTSKTKFIKHSEDIVGVRIGSYRLNSILTNDNGNINNYHLRLLSLNDFYNIQTNTPNVIVE